MQDPKERDWFPFKETPAASSVVDLTNCDSEPIHIPGTIQPHGYLIGFDATGRVVWLSRNIEKMAGRQAEDLLNRALKDILGNDGEKAVMEKLPGLKNKKHFWLMLPKHGGSPVKADVQLHKVHDLYILELELPEELKPSEADLNFFYESLRLLQDSRTSEALSECLVARIKILTGYDRVMIYHFKSDNSGEVIAEAREHEVDPYLGLHFPASDIPQQARALYLINPIRLIPDIYYEPVPLIAAKGQGEEPVLDLSQAGLRSVSPIHREYLHNMGVGASMSVSIIRNNKLWGMLACHHSQPTGYLSYQKRQLSELLVRSYAMIMNEKEEQERTAYREQIQQIKVSLSQQLAKADKITEGLYQYQPNVQQLINCGGCVLWFGEEYVSLGNTPSKEEVQALAIWLQKNIEEDVYATNQLASVFPEAEAYSDTGSGILAISVSRLQQEYIIWFRPEQVHEVRWAGREHEKAEGNLRPRKSFEAWAEHVKNRSFTWQPIEIEAARELRGIIVDIVLRMGGELKLRSDILARINEEMESDRDELESFAYIAAHDLKEPLRGIHHYATFVLEDYGEVLEEAGKTKLQTLLRLSDRMQQLINALLQFSRMGRLELEVKAVPMKGLVEGVLEIFDQQIGKPDVELQVPGEWPVINCDELRVTEVFMNLVSNALKYNDKDKKTISIGYRKATAAEIAPSGYVFFVKDNGIGIEERHLKNIFNIFRRLHARTAYGGGIGAGLTIAKKIVERHGGNLWVTSRPGEESCFYFSL